MFAVLTAAAAIVAFPATVVKVVDGDTLKVHVAGFPAPFDPIDVRVEGIDTPEHVKPPAKKVCEVKMGKAAMAYALTFVKAGDQVVIDWTVGHHDKYGRLLGTVTRLPDGADWGQALVAAKMARSYDGGTKLPWC